MSVLTVAAMGTVLAGAYGLGYWRGAASNRLLVKIHSQQADFWFKRSQENLHALLYVQRPGTAEDGPGLAPQASEDPRPQPEAEEPTLNPERGPNA